MKNYKDKTFHVISNTHWDREWRYPFQRNRQMLVDMIDAVLDILQKEPKYRAFHLDSQSIVIKDYLEIKPHKEEVIKNFVQQKRLFIGPWYVLPEQFQVGGENLVRNLLLGHKTCKMYGRVSKIGYSPFSWGQISQLPQIYKEFGIELIMFYRGVNSIDSPKAEFLWIGADGTEAVASRFSTMPRYNFYFYIYRPVVHNEFFSDVEYKWSCGGVPFHFADKHLADEDYFIVGPVDGYYPENIKKQVEAIINDQVDDFTTPHVIWMEGHDSSGPNIKTVRIIEDIKKIFPDLNVIHSTLEDYSNALFENIDIQTLKKVYGERRSAQYDRRSGNLYGYTTSARMYLKQKNFETERWIQFYAEPFNVFSALTGRDINDHYPDLAWDLIVQNSSHDSIGGCSLDEVHYDMMCRYKQAIEISKGMYERAIKFICSNINFSSFNSASGPSNIYLTVVNPNQFERDEIAECFIDIPKEFDKGNILIKNINDVEVPFHLISNYSVQPVLEQMIDRPMYIDMMRYHCLIDLKNVVPLGYTSLQVIPVEKSIVQNEKPTLNLIKDKNLKFNLADNNIIENDYLKIKINSNGTFDILDKANKISYNRLGYFYDEGEAGHAWVNTPVKPFIKTLNSKPKIKITENSKLRAKIQISHKVKIPKNLAERKKKNPKLTEVNLELFIILNRSSRHLELKIKVDNKAESHRLRIMFPSRIKAEKHFAEGQFDVVERQIKRLNTKDWIEQPMYDFPLNQFVDISDNKHGLAILVDGLKEYEVRDDKDRTIAVTLFRGFEYIIQPSSKQDYTFQKGSQCLGKSEYRLAIYPHSGNWKDGNVYREALNFNNQLSIVQTGKAKGKLPAELSFLKIEPEDLIFSALKKSEDGNGFVLRVYNPTEKDFKGEVEFYNPISKVEHVTLEEIFVREINLNSKNSFTVSLNKKKIGTYKIVFTEC